MKRLHAALHILVAARMHAQASMASCFHSLIEQVHGLKQHMAAQQHSEGDLLGRLHDDLMAWKMLQLKPQMKGSGPHT